MEEPKKVKNLIAVITPIEADLLRLVRLYEFGEVTVTDTRSETPRTLRIKNRSGISYQVVLEIQTNLSANSGLRLNDSIAILGDDEVIINNLVRDLVHKIKTKENAKD